nr:hypothetical protein [uncultured Dyadobacter sp.]
MQQESYEFSNDITERRALDAISEPLSNGWKVSVHWKSRLADLREVPHGEREEEYLIWWEAEKRKYNKLFVEFIEGFGLNALLTAVNVGKVESDFKRNIWFRDSETVEGLCCVKEVEIELSEKLIDIFITV